VNECTENEYWCHNGQCIPTEFFHDSSLNPDCLDRTDEPVDSYLSLCHNDPSFRCEEHTCRPGKEEFPCGDGQCRNGIVKCTNGRRNFLLNDPCSKAMDCLMKLFTENNNEWCKEFCTKDKCQSLYEFPSSTLLLGHVRLIFENKEREINTFNIPLPDYVCYDENLCAENLPGTVYLYNNSTCRRFHELNLAINSLYPTIHILVKSVQDRFRACLLMFHETHYCNLSTLYQCENSIKCISKHRLVDGIKDCPFGDDEKFNESCSLNDVHHRFKCPADYGNKCWAPLIILDGKKDCKLGEDERDVNEKYKPKSKSFFVILVINTSKK
jgi:hypothetical protein